MSEPSETSGRPLAPTTQQEPLPEGNTINPSPSTRTKHRKSSQPSDDCSEGSKSTSSRRRPGTTIKASSDPHAGSSRSEQRSTISPTNMSSHMSSVHYTRTGRISKAKKGLKVHNCECGRSYTRAEHLRRHQKNHAQDDALVCDFPDCGKTFYRVDLLHRHQERHNETGKGSPQASVFSPEGSPEARQASVSMIVPTSIVATIPPMSYYPPQPVSPMQESAAVPSHKQQQRGSYTGRQSIAAPVPIDGMTHAMGWTDAYSQSPGYSSSSGYASPIPGPGDYTNLFANPPYGHGSNRTRTSSNASFIEPWSYTPRSPVSSTSTMPYTWASNDKPPTASCLAYMGTSYPMSLGITTDVDPMSSYGHCGPKTMMQRDEEERVILFPEQPYGMGQIAHTYPLEQYLNSYWRLFHPTFPIVHRSSFESMKPSPMLHAAMIAVGGQYSSDTNLKRKSRILHDRCIKLLERRDQEPMAEADRMCDYQAVFLIEVLSQYRARRAAKTLSPRFGTLYHKVTENFRHTTSQLADIVTSLGQVENVTLPRWLRWIELSTLQRLLTSCYILESQQAMLLAREPHPSLFQESGVDLPFPAHTVLWDAATLNDWAVAAQQDPHSLQYVYDFVQGSAFAPCDSFQSSLLIAAHYNHFSSSSPFSNASPVLDIECQLDGSFVTKQKLLTAKLVQVTPVRALLAVSGESWILSEKVSSQQIFSQFKTTLRTWITQLWTAPAPHSQIVPVKEALKLSIDILQLALDERPESLSLEMGTDMGLYIAALILWAITAAASTRAKGTQQVALHAPRRQQSLPPSLMNQYNPEFIPSNPMQLPQSFSSYPSLTTAPAQSAILGPVHSQPTSPVRHDSLAATTLLSHDQITLNSTSFLSDAHNLASIDPATRSELNMSCLQAGCISLLLWVKLQLRGAPLEDQSGIDVWASRPGEGLGELLDSVVGSLERVLNRGWTGWSL